MRIVRRTVEPRLQRLLKGFPAVLVLGPRQAGKSTLTREMLPSFRHLDLERPSDRAILESDPEGFFDAHPSGVLLDEVQRLPSLFEVLRVVLDRGKGRGRFVLTGSAGPSLVRGASESLAGRVGMLELTPFLASELYGTPRERDRWFWGGYPPVHARRGATARGEWLSAYVTTFLERDLPALGLGLPAKRLRTLWTMLTHVHGNLLNVSDLSRSLGVSSPTVASDLDVLEASFLVRRLQPYFPNVTKRFTKSPKLYVRDTGLLHHLAGLRTPRELDGWSRRGASFEGFVIEEIGALAAANLVAPQLYFYRTHAGAEVDLLVVHGRRIIPIEIKLGSAFSRGDLAGMRSCLADLGLRRGFIVTGSGERRSASPEIEIVPFADVVAGRIDLFA